MTLVNSFEYTHIQSTLSKKVLKLINTTELIEELKIFTSPISFIIIQLQTLETPNVEPNNTLHKFDTLETHGITIKLIERTTSLYSVIIK